MERISKYLVGALKLTFVLGIITTLMLDLILKKYFIYYFINDRTYFIACSVFIKISGVCATFIIYELIKVMKAINEKNPFVESNIKYLKNIGMASFVISFCFICLVVFRLSIFAIAVSYTFLIAGFSFIVFSGLIKKGKDYKDENDLTV